MSFELGDTVIISEGGETTSNRKGFIIYKREGNEKKFDDNDKYKLKGENIEDDRAIRYWSFENWSFTRKKILITERFINECDF